MADEGFGASEENINILTEQEETRSNQSKGSTQNKKGKGRRWSDREVDELIDLLEDNTCLWNVSNKDYHIRNKRERAYKEMEEKLGIAVAEIKGKITSLRSQLGREIGKTRAKKSGQATSDNYKPTWPYWDRLQFLVDVMQAGKSRDTLPSRSSTPDLMESVNTGREESLNSTPEERDTISSVVETPCRPSTSRKRNAEQEFKTKHELLKTCIQVLKEPPPQPESKSQCTFSLYVAERLNNFDRRTRMLAEKRISDILF